MAKEWSLNTGFEYNAYGWLAQEQFGQLSTMD